ncbi:MAG: glycosyltransferase [Bacteroidetes bacterium]|nr:glycosyltransferase [Bacteroidota bacterium]
MKKKVLFLPRWYPNRFDPMPGLFIRRHAQSVSMYFEVSVLSVHLNFESSASAYEIEQNQSFGISEICIYTRASRTGVSTLDSLINFFRFVRAHFKGFKLLKKETGKPDLIHVNVLTRLGLIAGIYKMLYGVPYVITEHWTRYLPGMDNFNGWWRKLISRVVVRNASAVMPVTLNLQRAMESHGLTNMNYHVIPNVVDTELFRPKDHIVDKARKMFLHVSCFDDNQKNISGILKVLKWLATRRQDWVCTMTGEGIHYEKLVKMAEDLQLKDKYVYFTGLKENKDLVELMQIACFQVMFSRYENLPVVIPESFACGVPFISTDVGGIAEHIHKSSGILLPSEDEDRLLDALDYMLDHYQEYDKAAIRKYALDHFSQEVIGNQIRDVYEDVWKLKNRKSW